jgi:hypothetical protein
MSANIDNLKKQLEGLSARAALATLVERYRMSTKSFIFSGELYTIRSALTDIPEWLLDMPCGGFGSLRFYGGPPGAATWYEGSILTMLCDAVLFDENTKNLTCSELISS